MKYALFFTFLVSTIAFADDLKFKDMPTTIKPDMTNILNEYKSRAQASIDGFNEKFNAKAGKVFYVVTKLNQDGHSEQIFVKVKKIENKTYIGTIASDPLGQVKFKSGDAIKVNLEQLEDWSIVTADGNEEGNLQGKALDLVQVGRAAFISKVVPKDNKYISSTVASVRNPLTKQEIIEIVPEQVLKDVDAYVTKKFEGQAAENNKEIYVFTFVTFPEWTIVPEKK